MVLKVINMVYKDILNLSYGLFFIPVVFKFFKFNIKTKWCLIAIVINTYKLRQLNNFVSEDTEKKMGEEVVQITLIEMRWGTTIIYAEQVTINLRGIPKNFLVSQTRNYGNQKLFFCISKSNWSQQYGHTIEINLVPKSLLMDRVSVKFAYANLSSGKNIEISPNSHLKTIRT